MAFAQAPNSTYLTGLSQALNASGLTQLASVAAGINNTAIGQRLLSALPTKNWTIFAPNDTACTFAYFTPFVGDVNIDPFCYQTQQQSKLFPPTSPQILPLLRTSFHTMLLVEIFRVEPRPSRMLLSGVLY
jgi:hypothetical protein